MPIPINTLRTPDFFNGDKPDLQTLLDRIKKLELEQSNKIMAEGENNPAFQEKRDVIVNHITQLLADHMTSSLLEQVIGDKMEILGGPASKNPTLNVFEGRKFGSYLGGFVESDWFGLPKGNSPLPDIRDKSGAEVELKVHSAEDETRGLQVAGITIYGDPMGQLEDQTVTNILAFYRMALKMSSFLLIEMSKAPKEEIKPHGKGIYGRGVKFEAINLHMILYLKKLWDMLNEQAVAGVREQKAVYVETENNWENNQKIYNIKLSMEKVSGVYKWLELYLYHLDLLHDLKSDDNIRRDFFATIAHIQLTDLTNQALSAL